MIDKKQLQNKKEAFFFLSKALDFPDELLVSQDFLEDCLANYPKTKQRETFLKVFAELKQLNLDELKERYSTIFEFNKKVTLYMSFSRFEDSRERGTLLAKLIMVYEMFGVSLEKAELTDYLPAMLEFLAVADWAGDNRIEDLSLLFSVAEDGTYELLKNAFETENDPYIQLVKVAREELKECVVAKEVKE